MVVDAQKERNEDPDVARRIYMTFPAESLFTEVDVLAHFSNYGPVQEVWIPPQAERKFGFLTFVHPESAKWSLMKTEPHIICGSTVAVKPYRPMGKISDKKLPRGRLMKRRDFSGNSSPNGFYYRDPSDFQQSGPGVTFDNRELLLSGKMKQQEDEIDLYHSIESQRRKLELFDLKSQNPSLVLQRNSGAAVSTATTPFAVNMASSGAEDLVPNDSGIAYRGIVAAMDPSEVGSDFNGSQHHEPSNEANELINSVISNDKDPVDHEGNLNKENRRKARVYLRDGVRQLPNRRRSRLERIPKGIRRGRVSR